VPNIFKAIGGLVGRVAPVVGRAIGGPLGGIAVDLVKGALGIPDADEKTLEQRLEKVTTEDIVKLQELEQTHARFLLEADVKDRESARGLAKQKGIIVQAGLSVVFVTAYCILAYIFFAEMFGPSEELNPQLLGLFGTVFGVISTALVQILNFWFGSSEGSRRKTDQQHEILKNGSR
jgi:predicted membrane protein